MHRLRRHPFDPAHHPYFGSVVEYLDRRKPGGRGQSMVQNVALPFPFSSQRTDQPFRAGEERVYRYRLVTLDRRLDSQTLAQVERTRIGWVALPGETDPPPRTQRRFVVDFVVEDALSPMGLGKPEAVLETTAGSVSNLVVQPLPDRRGWRATFELVPDGNRPSDMRLFLETEGERLTETWSYVWYPDDVG